MTSLGYLNGVVIFYSANVVKSVWHVNLFRGTIGANSSRKKSNDCYLFAMRVLGQGRTNNCNSEVDILFGYTHWGLNTHYLRQKNIKKCLNLSTIITETPISWKILMKNKEVICLNPWETRVLPVRKTSACVRAWGRVTKWAAVIQQMPWIKEEKTETGTVYQKIIWIRINI